MKSVVHFIFALFVIASTASMAQDGIRQEQVQFQPGKTSASIKGHLKGDETVDYLLRAAAGQTMDVTLKASNLFTYFNVLPPNDETALFVGSSSGNHFADALPKDGEYTIRVYLMRNAARRGEKTDYTIDFKVTGNKAAQASTTGVDLGPTKFDASGTVKCSAGKASLDKECDFRVVRDLPKGAAEIWISNIAAKDKPSYRVLHYANKVFITTDKAKLSWQRQDDNWWVGADGNEFYLIPDALIHGG